MNPKSNSRTLSESLEIKTRELFPDRSEDILEFFATKFEPHFNNYKSLKGFTPSENLIKVLFIYGIRGGDLQLENCYFLSSLPFCLEHFYYGAITDRAEYEIYPMITPLEYIGSDGGGGSFFCDLSSYNDSFYHVWEEFKGVERMQSTLMDVIRLIKDGADELYLEVKNEFNFLLADHKCSYNTILDEPDFNKLTHLAAGIGLGNSAYIPITTFDYSYDYFVSYFQNYESDYFKYDDIVNTINSQLLAAFNQLYFSNHKEELQKLIQLTVRKTKGRIFNSHRDFFKQLLPAEIELKNRIVINFRD